MVDFALWRQHNHFKILNKCYVGKWLSREVDNEYRSNDYFSKTLIFYIITSVMKAMF